MFDENVYKMRRQQIRAAPVCPCFQKQVLASIPLEGDTQ